MFQDLFSECLFYIETGVLASRLWTGRVSAVKWVLLSCEPEGNDCAGHSRRLSSENLIKARSEEHSKMSSTQAAA